MRDHPDFFIMGAPKAGTTALNAALATHPELWMSAVKEPKYFLSPDAPPVPPRGPGDAHSVKEWVWSRQDYERLFAGAGGRLRGESTPLYLSDFEAQGRIAAVLPRAKLIVVVRDPVDRAYSNWLHLWSDGLEPIADFASACDQEEARIAGGWAPFWHYQRLGRYGEQIDHLLGLFSRSQLMLLRYRQLVDEPARTLDHICGFLGVRAGVLGAIPVENSRGFVVPTRSTRVLARTIRTGASAGAHLPPQLWRKAGAPFVWALQRRAQPRPELSADVRRQLVERFRDDVRLLERITGESFSDWLADKGRGDYRSRAAHAQVSDRAAARMPG